LISCIRYTMQVKPTDVWSRPHQRPDSGRKRVERPQAGAIGAVAADRQRRVEKRSGVMEHEQRWVRRIQAFTKPKTRTGCNPIAVKKNSARIAGAMFLA
jgi:hypothetical protein